MPKIISMCGRHMQQAPACSIDLRLSRGWSISHGNDKLFTAHINHLTLKNKHLHRRYLQLSTSNKVWTPSKWNSVAMKFC